MAKQTPNEIAAEILGQPVVDALGGIERIERRAPTEAEREQFAGSGLTPGDWIVFVPKAT